MSLRDEQLGKCLHRALPYQGTYLQLALIVEQCLDIHFYRVVCVALCSWVRRALHAQHATVSRLAVLLLLLQGGYFKLQLCYVRFPVLRPPFRLRLLAQQLAIQLLQR